MIFNVIEDLEARMYMESLRAVLLFFVILLVCGLLLLSFNQRGYEKIERVNQYVLYEKEVDECIDKEYGEFILICENKYILRSGLTESELIPGLNDGIITFDEIKEYIQYNTVENIE